MAAEFSRRSFLKGVTAMGLASSGLFSASLASAEAAASAAEPERTPDEILECDVLVVGMGASGMTACVKAAQDGARVIGADRASSFAATNNVNTVACMGIETKRQQEMEGHLTKKQAFKTIFEANHYQANAPFTRHAVEISGQAVDMLQDGGVTFMPAYDGTNDNNTLLERTGHVYTTGGAERGAQFQKMLDDNGVTSMWSTQVTKLLTENGKLTGALALTGDGKLCQINAKGGVVVACGGFIHNKEMVARYFGGAKVYSYSNAFCNGAGIQLAQSVGAQIGKNFSFSMNEGGGVNHKSKTFMTTLFGDNGLFRIELLGGVAVNKHGKRFVDEGELCARTMYNSEPICREGDSFYTIASQKTIDQLKSMTLGAYVSDVLHTAITEPIFNMYFAPVQLSNLDEDIETAIAEGWCWKGDSFEELAETTGLTHLAKTMSDYNAMCTAGEDTELYKAENFLLPYEDGPFYVIENDFSAWLTLGGIKTNGDCCALNASNDVIPGLYMAGCDGDFWAVPYVLGGSANGLCIASGYIAGEAAAKRAVNAGSYDAQNASLVAEKQAAQAAASESKDWNDGTYAAQATGRNGAFDVTVEIKDGKIASVTIGENQETAGIATPAIEQLPQEIVNAQSAQVDVIGGATVTSNAIKAAVTECLQKAAK